MHLEFASCYQKKGGEGIVVVTGQFLSLLIETNRAYWIQVTTTVSGYRKLRRIIWHLLAQFPPERNSTV